MATDRPREAARTAALRALAVRPRSVTDLSRRLQRRFDEETVMRVVQELQEQGLLDDAAFAAAWRYSREQFKPRSSALVRRELLVQGVEHSVASAAVAGMDDEEAARQAARKYARRLTDPDERRSTQRMRAYLARRGFASDVIQHTIRWVVQESLTWQKGPGLTQRSSP